MAIKFPNTSNGVKQKFILISKRLILSLVFSLMLFPAMTAAQKEDRGQGREGDRGGEKFFQRTQLRHNKKVCDNPAADEAACHARVATEDANPKAAKTFIAPSGYGPAQFRGAYGVNGIASSTSPRIIAIVDAYDHPSIKNDLDVYSAQFGIPTLPNCNVAIASSPVPCFKKVNQNGGTNYPQQNAGWALEIALDVEAAHALCQNCSILLVEASSASYTNLLAAEDRAAILGAKIISNSWGSNEFSSQTALDYHFNKPGVAITVSSGDSGYGAQYPASSRYITAVGGTSLTVNDDNSYGGETAWSGSGSGCSLYETKPAWQKDASCAKRTVADVSAVADPNTGAAVYDSVRYQGVRGWFQVGGTSLSAPIIAAIYALSGNTASPSIPYISVSSTPSSLRDVISGSNGSCGGSYLCTAFPGYDGPTGLGSPNGFGAF